MVKEGMTVQDGLGQFAQRAIDIEELLQWAIEQSIAMPKQPQLRVPGERELTLNPYDVHVKGADNTFHGGGTVIQGVRLGLNVDAQRTIDAIDALDPWSRSIVICNAKGKRRPEWMDGIEPVLVPGKRRHRGKRRQRWIPCSPEAVRATREIYARWHTAVSRLAARLDGKLTHWQITGFGAPVDPWIPSLEKAA